LALLYNAPRAASIKAKTDCVLWALDRDTFNNIVKDAAAKKRERYENFLGTIEILKSMDPYERSKIADALKTVKAKSGEYVIK
jgi:cAMP-dependent protein kinase regulator